MQSDKRNEHRRVYDLIWSQMPHMQNRMSSSWWFFLLFPRDERGYGRRQLMFSIATRVGEEIRINGVTMPGLDLRRRIVDGEDRFPAMAVGWYCDGRRVHEDIVKQTAEAELSANGGFIRCVAPQGDGDKGVIMCAGKEPLSLHADIRGQKGAAQFDAWGDLDSLHSSPHESLNIHTPAGGVHFIAWRHMHFRGEFDLPTGRETLEGLCYFQRVCLNVPTFPWKWIWALFPDGSMFSAYVPYVGLNLLRRGYRFFNSNGLEQPTLSIMPAGFWQWSGAKEQIVFDKAAVTPVLGRGIHPQFKVAVANKQGDQLSFLAAPYGHTRFWIDRPVLGGRAEAHWSYNEYMFRMEDVAGQVDGRPIKEVNMGSAYGSLEYAWGLGL